MLDIDKSIRKLITKYHINLNDVAVCFPSRNIQNKIRHIMKQLIYECPLNGTVLWGTEREINSFLKISNETNDAEYELVYEDADDTEELSDRIIDLFHGKTVIVFGRQIHRLLERKWFSETDDNNVQIIDIYDYLYVNGVDLGCELDCYLSTGVSAKNVLLNYGKALRGYVWKRGYFFFGYRVFNFIKVQLEDTESAYAVKQLYQQSSDKMQKEYYLRRLIWQYIQMRDFIHAQKYCTIYTSGECDLCDCYLCFDEELNSLLEMIKNRLKQRKYKDIIADWIDSVEYNALLSADGFAFLKEQGEKGLFFENAYTVMPWTQPTLKVVLTGKLPIDDHLFNIKRIDKKSSKLIKVLDSEKYRFKYNGIYRFDKYMRSKLLVQRVIKRHKWVSASLLEWNTICELYQSKRPMLILSHHIYETHGPFFFGDADKMRFNYTDEAADSMKDQQIEARKYLEEQLRWYEDFHSANVSHIYFSDHGVLRKQGTLDETRNHIFLIVNGPDICSQKISELVSLKDFYKLIGYVISPEKNDLSDIMSEYVFGQTYDYYSEASVEQVLNSKMDKRFWMQQRSVRTKHEQYILMVDGSEYYFILPDEKTNYIMDKAYENRINELRSICGSYFIDINKFDYFVDSRRLYKH